MSESPANALAGAPASAGSTTFSGASGSGNTGAGASSVAASAGAATIAEGGAPAAGGAAQGGTTPASPGGGQGMMGTFPWPAAYDAAAVVSPADGHHNPGAGCMSSTCHGSKVPFAFGGTVYSADGTTGASHVQVGISDGLLTLTTYSAANGNIWLPSSAGAITWANAVISIRDAQGERVKPATAPRAAACNGTGCHGSTMRLIAP